MAYRVYQPNQQIYIVYNGVSSDSMDTDDYQIYLDTNKIPEGSTVFVYSRTGQGKVEPRKFVQEPK